MSRSSLRLRLLLAVAAVALFVGGITLGIRIAAPPGPPQLLNSPDSPAPRDSGASSQPDRVVPSPPESAAIPPRVTIVIDDLGRSLDEVDRLLALEEPITFAVLPYEVRTAEVVAALRSHGAEYLCHLPMEAKGSADPGPGALELTMAHDELRATTRRALAAVPGAVGVNNHMGSGISSERRAIATVLGVIAEQGLSYLDSRTAADTVGFEVARQLGIPAAERHVFLDSDRSPESIRRQFETLLEQARQRGSAIAIGHPYPETLDVLQTELPRAREAGFVVVPLSHVLIDG